MELNETKTQNFKLVYKGLEVVTYEGGWWMFRSDYDRMWSRHGSWLDYKYGFDKDKTTYQLKPYLIP